MTNSFKSRGSS